MKYNIWVNEVNFRAQICLIQNILDFTVHAEPSIYKIPFASVAEHLLQLSCHRLPRDLYMSSSGLIIYSQTEILTDDSKFIIFVNPEECYGIQL